MEGWEVKKIVLLFGKRERVGDSKNSCEKSLWGIGPPASKGGVDGG